MLGLTSTIPTEIGGLTNLLFIDLDFNKLSGSFPTQLYSLTDLRTLDLNDNEMTGSIDQLGVFLDLEFLQLQRKLSLVFFFDTFSAWSVFLTPKPSLIFSLSISSEHEIKFIAQIMISLERSL